jgi:membrane associated rhomboid family serine protease
MCRAAQWAQTSPIVSRVLVVLTVVCSLTGMLFGYVGYVLNVPVSVLAYFQVYRLVLAPLYESSLLSFLFGVLGYVFMGPLLELKVGSARLLSLSATMAVVTGVAYDLLAVVLAYNPVLPVPSLMSSGSGGAWLVLVGYMSVDAVLSPEVPRNMCCMNVPNKYLPWVFVGLMVLLAQAGLDLLVACVVGHAYAWGYLDAIKPTDAQLRVWEAGWLSGLARQPGFVTVDAAGTSLFVAGQQGGGGGGGDWARDERERAAAAGAGAGAGAGGGGGARGNVRTLGGGGAPGGGKDDHASGTGAAFRGAGHAVLSTPASPVAADAGSSGARGGGSSSAQARAAAANAAKERLAAQRGSKRATPKPATPPATGAATAAAAATAPQTLAHDEDVEFGENDALLGHEDTIDVSSDWGEPFGDPPAQSSASASTSTSATATATATASASAALRPAPIALPVDEASVDLLTSMGFGREEAIETLRITHGDVGSAAALLAQSTL